MTVVKKAIDVEQGMTVVKRVVKDVGSSVPVVEWQVTDVGRGVKEWTGRL